MRKTKKKSVDSLLKNQSIVIATHQMVYGVPQALRDYLLKKNIANTLFIGLPLLFNREYSYYFYKRNKLVDKRVAQRKTSFGMLEYFLDFYYALWWVVKQKKRFTVFLGFDCLNTLAGLILKKLGRVEKVVFYTMDFTPQRFKNNLLNNMYHAIEKFSIYHADEVWDVSPRMQEGREAFFHIPREKYIKRIVPVGVWSEEIKRRKDSEIKRHQVLFMGTLYEKQGVQLVLDAIPHVVKKIKDFHFIVMGGGEFESSLKIKAKKLQIEKYVTFMGWVKDRKIIDDLMTESAFAVAPYKPEKERKFNFTYFADPYKLKDYLVAGLPVIVTDVPFFAGEIQKKQCGVLIDYNKKAMEDALMTLLTNDSKVKEFRQNALRFSREFHWNKIYDKTFLEFLKTS